MAKIESIQILPEPKIFCATWQSIFKQPKSWFDQFDVVICDEVHTAVAKSLSGIMAKLSYSKVVAMLLYSKLSLYLH